MRIWYGDGVKGVLRFAAIWGGVLLFLPLFSYADINAGNEALVKAYFANVPVMAEIARCESRFRQLDEAGAPLYGGLGDGMVGVFQIHARIHAEFAADLGMDIYTLPGNLAYAKYLYENEGTRPWYSSYKCWGAAENAPAETTEAQIARLQAQVVELTSLLALLQQRYAVASARIE